MSDLIYKGFDRRKGHRSPDPSHRRAKNKYFRIQRKIIKQERYKAEQPTVTGFLAKFNRLVADPTVYANNQRIHRQEVKKKKLEYFEAGNKHLNELKHIKTARQTAPTQTTANACGHWMQVGGSGSMYISN